MAFAEKRGKGWRGRYRRPDGSYGSTAGHPTKKRALAAAEDEESRIRHNTWIDPRVGEISFEEFAEEWFASIRPRLAPSTAAKYRTYLDRQLLPQWRAWPMLAIFNSHLEIEKWVAELHEGHAESSVSAYFATFSTIMNAAVRSRVIPASPCPGIHVSSGYEPERLVATPVQGLRAAMRLYESGLGLGGLVLCLLDLFTGARWGELAGQERHEYDEINKAIGIREPLKEDRGKLFKGGHDVSTVTVGGPGGRSRRTRRGAGTKTPASTRWVKLSPTMALLYERLLDSHVHRFVFVSPAGHPWHRSNFRMRFWRPAWDGTEFVTGESADPVPAILPGFTFHEGRHTHSTWLAADRIPEVARRARLGHRMRGMGRVYDHVTPEMERQVVDALEERWSASLGVLSAAERGKLLGWIPNLRPAMAEVERRRPVGIIGPEAGDSGR